MMMIRGMTYDGDYEMNVLARQLKTHGVETLNLNLDALVQEGSFSRICCTERHSFTNLVEKMMSVISQGSERFHSHWKENMAERQTAILGRLPLCSGRHGTSGL